MAGWHSLAGHFYLQFLSGYAMQYVQNSSPRGFSEFLNQVVENASDLPGDLSNISQQLNNDLIDFARDLQEEKTQVGQTIESNLRDNKTREVGGNVASWLTNEGGLVKLAFGLFVVWLIGGALK